MELLQEPVRAMAVTEEGRSLEHLVRTPEGWAARGTVLEVRPTSDGTELRVTSEDETPQWLGVGWDLPVQDSLVLGDAWERAYGDLGWAPVRPERVLPWYWLAHDLRTGLTMGAGVKTGARALCSWTVGPRGVTCWLDLRNGGGGTRLAGRTVHAATVVDLAPEPDRSSFDAARRLVSRLADRPQRARPPVVGANNWYYAYGENFDTGAVLRDASIVSELAGDHAVRPFSVIDAGWSSGGTEPGGPWDAGLPGVFDDMPALAQSIRDVGARPGIWFRPLLSRVQVPEAREERRGGWALDPSLPETLARVEADAARLHAWGYDLLKYDFSTYDAFGFSHFGGDFGVAVTKPGWSFGRRDVTNAEVLLGFYAAIRRGAGSATVMGCNTVGHLTAGSVDVQRIGDDTSGRAWERTRRMGVNSLAFRLPQHGQFFTVDADCVAVTAQTPWEPTQDLAQLIAASGTALFLSIDPTQLTADVRAAMGRAVHVALDGGRPDGVEPLDWLTTSSPERWRVGTDVHRFDWQVPNGGLPFSNATYP